MRLCDAMRLGSGIVAATSGLLGFGAHVVAQAAPQGGQLEGIATSLGTGSVLVGSSGVLIAISTLLKPYWDDRQKQRDFEENKLRITSDLQRNNANTLEQHRWIVEAKKQVPSLPEPPRWVPLREIGDYPKS